MVGLLRRSHIVGVLCFVAGCGGAGAGDSQTTDASDAESTATMNSGGSEASSTGAMDTSEAGDTSDGSDATDTSTTTDGSETTGGPEPMGWLPVVGSNASAIPDSTDVAIAPDGTIYVSWVQNQANNDAYVARSLDGGMTWSSPSVVDDQGLQPRAGSGRQPYLAVTDEDVYIVYDVADVAAGIFMHRSAAADAMDFSDITTLVSPGTSTDYAHIDISASGELWAAWQQYEGDPAQGRIVFSRESNGFAIEEVSASTPGIPCECCRLDLRFNSGGDAILAYRNNVGDLRNMWALRAASGTSSFAGAVEASHTDWMSFVCPMEGPSLADDGARQYIAWADSSSGEWRAYVGTSDDAGQSWGDAVLLAPNQNGLQGSPVVAVGDSGTVYAVMDVGGSMSVFVTSDDQGASWSEPVELANDSGNILNPRVRSENMVTGAVGVAQDGSVWFYRFE